MLLSGRPAPTGLGRGLLTGLRLSEETTVIGRGSTRPTIELLLRRDAVGAAAQRPRALDVFDLGVAEAEHVAEDLLRVLPEKG